MSTIKTFVTKHPALVYFALTNSSGSVAVCLQLPRGSAATINVPSSVENACVNRAYQRSTL